MMVANVRRGNPDSGRVFGRKRCFMVSSLARSGAATLLLLAWLPATGPTALDRAGPLQVPTVKSVAMIPIQSVQGKDNFDAYCAVCHGRDAKGHGPAAPAMKREVPDLTTMAERNRGAFNALAVEYIIRGKGRTATPAHGVEDMPIWGQVFRTEDPARSTLRINNLVTYIQGLQTGM
jgi:mono/diheme cytochrome c family protein